MTSTANKAPLCNSTERSSESCGEQSCSIDNRPRRNSEFQQLTSSLRVREWMKTPYGRKFFPRPTAQIFKLVSYNILSQDLLNIHSRLYTEHNPNALTWEHRLNCLKQEIKMLQPHILCLQEVQQTHLNDILEVLKPFDFAEPLYKKRNGPQVDGCAIFYNKKLFKLVDKHYVEYYQPNVEVNDSFPVRI